MNKKIILSFFGLLLLFQIQVNACAPFTTNQIIVGKYNGLTENIVPDREAEGKFQFIDFGNTEKLFSKSYTKLGKYYFVDTARIDLLNYQKGDFIITISDYDDGLNDDYFTIYEMGKISCNSNNELTIEKRQGKIKEFGKNIWTCGDEVPDYILSEKEILKIIEKEYSICSISIEQPTITNIEENKIISIEDNIQETDLIPNKLESNSVIHKVTNVNNNKEEKSWYINIISWFVNFIKFVQIQIFE